MKSITIKFNKAQTSGEVVFSPDLMKADSDHFIAAIQDAIMLLQSELLTAENETDTPSES